MRFLRRIEGVTLFDKVGSFEIRKSLKIEPLLLRIKSSQLIVTVDAPGFSFMILIR